MNATTAIDHPSDAAHDDTADQHASGEDGRLPDYVLGATLLAAGANEVLQQSIRGLGRGVIEAHQQQKVPTGSVFVHPLKRLRTTIGYIGIALAGTEHERRAIRRDVGRSHAPVHSDETSPVPYSAFDHDLQLWVTACLYVGLIQINELLHGPLPDAQADHIYHDCERLGTTLQLPPGAWPATRADFDEHWNRMLDKIELDDEVRDYLYQLMRLEPLPTPISQLLGPAYTFITIGFLPQRFRDELGASWGPGRQRTFDAIIGTLATINRVTPRIVRQFPFNLALWDTRRRIAHDQSFT